MAHLTQEQLAGCRELGKQFTNHYYQIFDQNRDMLVSLYNELAVLSFEGETFVGPAAIVQKLKSLSFQQIQHVVTTIDSHLFSDGGILVVVVGQLKADADAILGFNQTFVLRQVGDSYQIFNDVFRLVLHNG
ncbi:nuclear transport factor 2-like [Amphiura filiformis]|uniref:nuclear transport factor 2-like n=1 Tax=Amphiura filiformis TaxID=82378 RepID=UPI003B226A6A